MTRIQAGRFASLLAVILSLSAMSAPAQEYRYQYVSLDEVDFPPGFFNTIDVAGLTNGGRVYGTVYEESGPDGFIPYVAYYQDGELTILQPGFASAVNEAGTVGGSVLLDPIEFTQQAAIFQGDRVEVVPSLPGEYLSGVLKITDSGLALVLSYDEAFNATYFVYKNGKVTPLPGIDGSYVDINNQGTVSGTTFIPGLGDRAFRYDTRTGERTLLDPLPTETDSWGPGINSRGDVLGYSFIFGGLERIGVWDRRGQFQTYFVEGTPQFPTVSNQLLFNDNNLIVITATNDRNSYLVPRPGVRLNLADLVEDAPQRFGALSFIYAVNNRGDMFGYGYGGFAFYLKRVGGGD